MKTYVTFENGYQEVENMAEAIIVADENPTTNYIVEIDEESLPEDVSVEDCVYASEDKDITRTYNWQRSIYKIGNYKNGQ